MRGRVDGKLRYNDFWRSRGEHGKKNVTARGEGRRETGSRAFSTSNPLMAIDNVGRRRESRETKLEEGFLKRGGSTSEADLCFSDPFSDDPQRLKSQKGRKNRQLLRTSHPQLLESLLTARKSSERIREEIPTEVFIVGGAGTQQ